MIKNVKSAIKGTYRCGNIEKYFYVGKHANLFDLDQIVDDNLNPNNILFFHEPKTSRDDVRDVVQITEYYNKKYNEIKFEIVQFIFGS